MTTDDKQVASDARQPPVVDYLVAADAPLYPRRRPLAASIKAFLLVVLASTIGIVLWMLIPGKGSSCYFVVPFIWGGAAWYVGARAAESSSPTPIRIVKGWMAVLAVLLSPFLLCHSPTAPSLLTYAFTYGWHSRHVGDYGRISFAALGFLLAMFATADWIDWVLWPRRRSRAETRSVEPLIASSTMPRQ